VWHRPVKQHEGAALGLQTVTVAVRDTLSRERERTGIL
jgi:hypothetical protein